MVVDGFGCWQIVLGGFKWFSMTYTFNDLATVKFVALNLKEVNNNGEFFNIQQQDAKVPLTQMTKFLRNSTCKVSFEKNLAGREKFCLMKIDIYSFV